MPAFRRHLKGALPDMSCHLPNLRRFAVASTLATLLVSGCAPVQLQPDAMRTADDAFAAMQELNPGQESQRFLLRAAARFQEQGNHETARRILRSSSLQDPVKELAGQHLLLSMNSALALNDGDWAQILTNGLTPETYTLYPEQIQSKAARLQADLHALAGQWLAVARLLMSVDPELMDSDRQAINDRIWQALKRTPDNRLQKTASSAVGFESQGWFELAATLRQPGMTLEQQARAIRHWQFNWTGHSGADVLPGELYLMATILEQRPERITLALPLSGPLAAAGNMVREGFLAAFYASGEQAREGAPGGPGTEEPGPDNTRITIVDTHGRPFSEVMQEAVRTRPDLIVGPLAKEPVADLSRRERLPVPVLALNYAPDDTTPPPAELVQFGLSAEDEARQIADRIVEEDLARVLALIPEGDWGDRVADTLTRRLKEQGGVILNLDRYFDSDNFREITADLLGINTSRQRAIEVEQTIGLNVEFEPRRRQDAEAIVMVAEPVIARQFKPLFAYYFAGDVPVFSPSIIYSGRPDPSRDRDVNGVYFTDLPWILAPNQPFRQKARERFENLDGPLGRLFAMGADAWALSTRLPLMRQVEDSSVEGHTGELTLAENGHIHRTQLWGVFREGVPVLLPADGGLADGTSAVESDEPGN